MKSVREMEVRYEARLMFKEEGSYNNRYDIINDALEYKWFMDEVDKINEDQRRSACYEL